MIARLKIRLGCRCVGCLSLLVEDTFFQKVVIFKDKRGAKYTLSVTCPHYLSYRKDSSQSAFKLHASF